MFFGDAAPDPICNILPCSDTVIGNLFLMLVYGYILGRGSKMIADGSELLCEIINPGIIGGLVLPILGALPDSAIIIASVLGASNLSQKELANKVTVGVGTLAGSTVMLLTVPWAGSLIAGRCDVENNLAVDNKSTKFSIKNQGVTCDEDCPYNARIMALTTIPYFVIEIPAFYYMFKYRGDQSEQAGKEKGFALIGAIVAFVLLAAYCVYMCLNSKLQERRFKKARDLHNKQKAVSQLMLAYKRGRIDEDTPLLGNTDEEQGKAINDGHMRALGLRWKTTAHDQREQAKEKAKDAPAADGEEEPKEWTKKQILMRSTALMAIGTIIVGAFCDSMVAAMSGFAVETDIPPFIIAFVVSPLASNASEVISSFVFAAKKKKSNISITFAALYGAATMNNTMCLGIFLVLIYTTPGLLWTFTSETFAIFFCIFAMTIIAGWKRTFRLWWGIVVIALYPISLIIYEIVERWEQDDNLIPKD